MDNTNIKVPMTILTDNASAVADQFLGWAKTAAENAASFTAEQTPLFVKEFIQWAIVSNLIEAVFWFLLIGVWWVATKKVVKYYHKSNTEYLAKGMMNRNSDDMVFPKVLLAIAAFGCFISIITLYHCVVLPCGDAAKAYFAPRVYLVDYLLDKAQPVSKNSR